MHLFAHEARGARDFAVDSNLGIAIPKTRERPDQTIVAVVG
jgi:hypothetical protein